jgi:hypothetical protein
MRNFRWLPFSAYGSLKVFVRLTFDQRNAPGGGVRNQEVMEAPEDTTSGATGSHKNKKPRPTAGAVTKGMITRTERYDDGSGTGNRTPVPWLRTTCPDP